MAPEMSEAELWRKLAAMDDDDTPPETKRTSARIQEPRYSHAIATATAEVLLLKLRPACDRIEIAGSVRRGVGEVKDLELVAVPKRRRDLFGEPFDGVHEVDILVDELIAAGVVELREYADGVTRNGHRYKALRHIRSQLPLDLFLVLPPQWGAIFAIRTGPADYSRRLVTALKANRMGCVDGRVLRYPWAGSAVEVATPEERDFIELCGFKFVEPSRRR